MLVRHLKNDIMHMLDPVVLPDAMKASGGFGTMWMTDLIKNIVKEGCIPDDWRKSILVPVYKGKVIYLCVGHTDLLGYWRS